MTRILTVLLTIGVLLSLVLVFHDIDVARGVDTRNALCNIGGAFDCDTVAKSPYARLFGWPVAAWGLAGYLLMLSFVVAPVGGVFPRGLVLLFGAIASSYSLALFFLSVSVIGALCLYCTALYLVNFAILGIALALFRGVPWAQKCKEAVLAPLAMLTQPGVVRRGLLALSVSIVGFASPLLIESRLEKRVGGEEEFSKAVVAAWRSSAFVDLQNSPVGLPNGDLFDGPPSAPARLTVFSDFQCPSCARFAEVTTQLHNEFPESLVIYHRNYPLDSTCNDAMERPMHQFACLGAQIARCGAEQFQYHEVKKYLYEFDYRREIAPAELEGELWQGLGVFVGDLEGLKACVASGRHLERVKVDVATANRAQVTGTPTVFLNGRRLANIAPDAVRAAIRAAITDAGR